MKLPEKWNFFNNCHKNCPFYCQFQLKLVPKKPFPYKTVLLANFMQKRHLFTAQFQWNSGSYFEFQGSFLKLAETAASFTGVCKINVPFQNSKKVGENFAQKNYFSKKVCRVSKKSICTNIFVEVCNFSAKKSVLKLVTKVRFSKNEKPTRYVLFFHPQDPWQSLTSPAVYPVY